MMYSSLNNYLKTKEIDQEIYRERQLRKLMRERHITENYRKMYGYIKEDGSNNGSKDTK